MRFLLIVLMCVAAAALYGIVHDQVTARVCVEYFTVAHPRLFGETTNPTVLALGWGVVATWWMGVLLGCPLAAAARWGPWPKRSPGSVVKPIAVLLVVMGCLAAVSGLLGYAAASRGWLVLFEPWASRIAPERHAVFLADAVAHSVSYGAGAIGGIALCFVVVFGRWREVQAGRGPLR